MIRPALIALAALLPATLAAQETAQPETTFAVREAPRAEATAFMAAAAHPAAVEAARAVLAAGGSAADAAVAVQIMLTLVEPQSSGLGGGTFLLYWTPRTAR
jgi:gamma-glutamyltranspeptidase / glutathione hydrolase